MSLTRDVPFSKYGVDETTIAASGRQYCVYISIVFHVERVCGSLSKQTQGCLEFRGYDFVDLPV